MNLAFPELVCDHMMDKSLSDINCGKVSDRQDALMSAEYNLTVPLTAHENGTVEMPMKGNDSWQLDNADHDFEMEVCRAERESQKLGSTISAYIAPFGKV